MPPLPVLKDKELVRILIKLGFREVRQTGSHLLFRHTDGRRTVVAIHSGRDIPAGTLRAILRDISVEVEELVRMIQD